MTTKQYDKPLILTSPPMVGNTVRDAQWLLSGHSRFGPELAPLKDGARDGIYGRETAGATMRAKYWLGYPTSAQTQVFGQTLYEYLRPEKWRPLPKAYRDRRDARLDAAQETPGKKALDVAITQIGVKENMPPYEGRNCQKYGDWYRFNCVAWCAIFDSWCFDQSGYKRFRYSYVPDVYDDARMMRNGLRLIQSPQPGDLALHHVGTDRLAHISFFEKAIDGSSFYDVGGNTGPVDISNGGAVMRQTRFNANISAFVRVG